MRTRRLCTGTATHPKRSVPKAIEGGGGNSHRKTAVDESRKDMPDRVAWYQAD